MKDRFYFTEDLAIINFDMVFPTTKSGLMKTPEFKAVALSYTEYLHKHDPEMYNWLTCYGEKSPVQAMDDINSLARMALTFDRSELHSPYLDGTDNFLHFVQGLFNFWKKHERYSVTTNRKSDMGTTAFVDANSQFNDLIRDSLRTLEQTFQVRKNKIFRQQHAGTDAGISCYSNDKNKLSERYDFLKKILFIDSVMLRTPLILHPKSNKREGIFEEVKKNPAFTFSGNPDEYFCFPAKVGSLMIFICFHRDYMANGVSCANLFEIATPEEAKGRPDGIVIFGNPDGKDICSFYHDRDEDIWVGSVSSNKKVEYFGYMKKMVLTIHNLIMMDRGWLPIHGAFINVFLKNGTKKGICLMGDSGAGKSETIEALKSLGNDKIQKLEIIFDDMGTFHIEDGVAFAQGTETGAFVRLDDLDPGAPYRDIDRSIFFNPDQLNSRVITPAAPYPLVIENHRIDLFAYANNYDEARGLREIVDMEEAKAIFISGKRMAKGTTQETGLSETYFANPFGPMQKKSTCEPIIDEMFRTLKKNGTFIGEAFTHLGINPEGDDIGIAAEALLEFIEGK
ncbi:MAG: hypothetical protein PHS19_02420 [Eubacteriales bacterium]|nr:hypothetical protein [Eubacteriales bacterium]